MNDRARFLTAAHLTTATGLGYLGQLLSGSERTFFGPPGEITAAGLAYCGALGVFLVASLGALWAKKAWSRATALLIPALNLAAFLPGVAADPVVAGGFSLWNLWLIGRLASLPIGPEGTRARPAAGVSRWMARGGPALRHLLLVGALVSIAVVGFERVGTPSVWLVCATLSVLALGTALPAALATYREGARWPWLYGVAALALAGSWNWPGAALLLLAACQLLVAIRLTAHDAAFPDLRRLVTAHPALSIVASFVGLILVGTLVLSFPAASTAAGSISLIDALFTATSAVCVTGLIVLDTPTAFTTFGHAVILILIQCGGLNIMVLSTFGLLLLGRRLGLRDQRALDEMVSVKAPASAYRLIGVIVAATFVIEIIGAALLTVIYSGDGVRPLQSAWLAVFHSVSAFCNAGFALHSDSLTRFADNIWATLTVGALITLGGLGFVVLAHLLPGRQTRELASLRTHTRVVVLASIALTTIGTALFALNEWNGALAGLGTLDRLHNALFQSVSLRTAGFNTVAIPAVGTATSLWMMAFMFIGASPGGTGGGIKTSTAVLLLAAVPAIMRGRRETVIARRSVPLTSVYRSAAIVTSTSLVVLVGAMLLMATQRGTFQNLLFESFSAVGTVGLSLGATAELDSFGKAVVSLLMLVGRVGPLSLTLLLGSRPAPGIKYPEAQILVG